MLDYRFPEIHAHRGFVEEAPESTLSAFKLAVENGADGIEFDLHYTRDHKIVVHHDFYLGRTSNGNGYISYKTYDDLFALDAGSWFSDRYIGEKIPLFGEVLELFKNKCKMEVQLVSLTEDFLHDAIDLINQHKMLDQVEITSSYPYILVKVRQYHPTIKIGVFLPEEQFKQDDLWCLNATQTMQLIGADVAHVPSYRLNEYNVTRLKKSGYIVHASDCNNLENLRKAADFGVHQLSTDKVKQAIVYKNQLMNQKR